MQDSLSYIILILMGVIIYLLLTLRKNKEEPKDNTQEINNLKESINNSFNKSDIKSIFFLIAKAFKIKRFVSKIFMN